jgi:hypothetical protein
MLKSGVPIDFWRPFFAPPRSKFKKYCIIFEQSTQGNFNPADKTRDKLAKKYGNGPILLREKIIGGQKNPLDKLMTPSILRARL